MDVFLPPLGEPKRTHGIRRGRRGSRRAQKSTQYVSKTVEDPFPLGAQKEPTLLFSLTLPPEHLQPKRAILSSSSYWYPRSRTQDRKNQYYSHYRPQSPCLRKRVSLPIYRFYDSETSFVSPTTFPPGAHSHRVLSVRRRDTLFSWGERRESANLRTSRDL